MTTTMDTDKPDAVTTSLAKCGADPPGMQQHKGMETDTLDVATTALQSIQAPVCPHA